MAAAATAPARRPKARAAAPARRAPRAVPAPRRAPRPAQRTGFVPVAVGAVGGIADSGIVLGLTRSRLWIGVLGTLLVGIVALNVMALSFNASSSKTASLSDDLRRENSALRADIADRLSNERLQEAATSIGLVMPEAAATLMLTPGAGDAAEAAKRLASGQISLGSTYTEPVAVVPVEPTAVDPTLETPVTDPTVDPAAVAPVETTTPVTDTGTVTTP